MKPKTALKAAKKTLAHHRLSLALRTRLLPETAGSKTTAAPPGPAVFFRQLPAKVAASACMAGTLWSAGASGRAVA